MAARTSTSIGMGVTITILSLLTLTLFVFSVVFFGRYKEQLRQNDTLRTGSEEIILAGERGTDQVRNLIEDARKERKSLVNYLMESQGAVMERVTGSRRDRVGDLTTKLSRVPGADTSNLLALIAARDSRVASLNEQLKQAEAARVQAIADRTNEVQRVESLQKSHQDTVDNLNQMVNAYHDQVVALQGEVDKYKSQVDERLERVRADAGDAEKRLADQNRELNNTVLIQRNTIEQLRGERRNTLFSAKDEASLADGRIIGLADSGQRVYLSIGSNQKVQLGMTFSVYPDANAIHPDANGVYPRGKGTLEVVALSPDSATARITGETRGNPIVKGDVIANPLYDPHKVYRFVVFGNFDTDGDGVATPLERQSVEAMIKDWGGEIVNDLTGDVDFLVLGQRPILPPRPPATAPLAVVSNFVQLSRDAERYDALYRQAVSTSVPILNENRLNTLVGRAPVMAAR